MTRPHIPDLAALNALPDMEIRFYAAVGAVISLTAALELTLADVFKGALNIDVELAKKLLRPVRNTSLRRDLAIIAMAHRVQGDSALAPEWEKLHLRLQTTGAKGHRNLVGHNPISKHTTGDPWGGSWGANWGSSWGGVTQFFVRVSTEGLAMREKPRKVDFEALLTSARELIDLLNDLDVFLKKV